MSQANWLARDWTGEALFTFMHQYGASPMDYFRVEGYWGDGEAATSPLPLPQEDSWDIAQAQPFLTELDLLEAELERRHLKMQFMGHSRCRLCGCLNGSTEYFLEGWKWPSGLRHYIEAHRVAPSPDFQALVKRATARLR